MSTLYSGKIFRPDVRVKDPCQNPGHTKMYRFLFIQEISQNKGKVTGLWIIAQDTSYESIYLIKVFSEKETLTCSKIAPYLEIKSGSWNWSTSRGGYSFCYSKLRDPRDIFSPYPRPGVEISVEDVIKILNLKLGEYLSKAWVEDTALFLAETEVLLKENKGVLRWEEGVDTLKKLLTKYAKSLA